MSIREWLERLMYATKSFSLCFSWVIGFEEWSHPPLGEIQSLTTPCHSQNLSFQYPNIYFSWCQYTATCHHFPEQPKVFSLTPHFFKSDCQTVGEPWQICVSRQDLHASNSCVRMHISPAKFNNAGGRMLSRYGVSLFHCSVSINIKRNLHSNFSMYLRIPLPQQATIRLWK